MNKKDALERLKSIEEETKQLRKIIENPKDLFTDISDYSDVCRELNTKELTIKDFNFLPEEQRENSFNSHRLHNIVKLFNSDWEADFTNINQKKWFPWFKKDGSGGWVLGTHTFNCVHAHFSVGLYYKDEKTCSHCTKLFMDIYKKYLG